MGSSLTLFVPRVHCADETTGSFRELFGNDEIYLGAVYVGISADKSFDVRVVQTRLVGDNFDDNETVNWNQELFTYDLGDPVVHPYPKAVLTSLVLAEHDWGDGRNDFVASVAEEFRKTLTAAAIDSVVSAALTATTLADDKGSEKPEDDLDPKKIVVNALSEWAKEQIKKILDEAVAQAKAWAGDEIFPPVLKQLKLDSATHTWNGSSDTPEEIAEFTGHDGKSQASIFWQLRSIDEPKPEPKPELPPPNSTIYWHHDDTGETQIWFMNGHQLVGRATVVGEDGQPAPILPPFRIVGVADMNADGRADIVWHHDLTGETQIWFMNEHQLVGRATVVGEDGQPAPILPPFLIVGAAALPH